MQKYKPRLIEKESHRSGGRQWGPRITQLVLELLSHQTAPSCIAPAIQSVAEFIQPDCNVVRELPSIQFIRYSRGTLSYLTKLLGANKIGHAKSLTEFHGDGTKRRQTDIQNAVLRIATEDGGYENVVLDSAILSEDETAEMTTDAILRSFQNGRRMLTAWRRVTMREFPDRPDLLVLICEPSQLTMAKLADGGWIMTDTCNTARKFRKLLKEAIKEVAIAEGMDEDEVVVWEAGKYLLIFIMNCNTILTTLQFHSQYRLLAASTKHLVRRSNR